MVELYSLFVLLLFYHHPHNFLSFGMYFTIAIIALL